MKRRHALGWVASLHPYRDDAVHRLDAAIDASARLPRDVFETRRAFERPAART